MTTIYLSRMSHFILNNKMNCRRPVRPSEERRQIFLRPVWPSGRAERGAAGGGAAGEHGADPLRQLRGEHDAAARIPRARVIQPRHLVQRHQRHPPARARAVAPDSQRLTMSVNGSMQS